MATSAGGHAVAQGGARDSADAPADAEERLATLALALVPTIGCIRHRQLVAQHGSARAALHQGVGRTAGELARSAAADVVARATACSARLIAISDTAYPASLLDLPDPPPVLYALGDLGLLGRPQVAIVGTRAATPYARDVAHELARALALAGVAVTSGMARGVDGAAHQGALDAGGHTVAVLGTGVDIAYPRSHAALHRRIAGSGLLVSELPPGDRADAGSFPRRNRIIAALATVTVVVQAGHRSGALITAAHALELGRSVAAVPGPIDIAAHAGSNELLRDGAQVIASAADLLQLAGASPAPVRQPALIGAEAAVWEALAQGPADLDGLLLRTRLPTRDCAVALGSLELAGLVVPGRGGELRRVG